MQNFIFIAALLFFAKPEQKTIGSIKINIEGITENKGHIVVDLYNNQKGFPTKPNMSYKQFIIPIKNLKSELTIDNLPTGVYAIAVYQDTNDNGKVDTNFFGKPTEKTGVSNNPKVLFIPNFEDAKFKLTDVQSIQTIKLK